MPTELIVSPITKTDLLDIDNVDMVVIMITRLHLDKGGIPYNDQQLYTLAAPRVGRAGFDDTGCVDMVGKASGTSGALYQGT